MPNIELEGIFTHLARADEATTEAAEEQFLRFIDELSEKEQKELFEDSED